MKALKILLSLFLLTSQLLATQIFYVKTTEDGGSDSNDGKSWASAFADVQKAIDAATSVATSSSPAQVWIAKGTYTTSSYYRMRNNVEIYGGFAGTETKLNERVSGNETILTRYVDYVFRNSSINNTARLDSVTITSSSSLYYGIYNYYSSPTITNCKISVNYGCGIYNYHASPTIINCTISENSSNGIWNKLSSSPTIMNCTIAENGGNGIYNDESSCPTITNCMIANNGSSGIRNYDYSSPTITNCIITGNGYVGIYNSSSSPTITNCTISGNEDGGIDNDESSSKITNCTIAGNGYIGISNSSSSPTITNCTIYNNENDGILNYDSDSTITNCTISGNERYGIWNRNSSSPTVTNCTISENGSGIWNEGSSSNPTITNCIIWGNDSRQIYNSSSSSAPSVSYCVIEGGYSSGTNIITEDPLLGGLGNYGGFVDTIPVLAGSSAIKKGTSTCAPEKDARGITRANPPCIGAFEASTQTPTAISLIAKEAIIVGRETEIIACSDGNPDEYILYKDGREIARQNTNVFKITPTENGCYKYSVAVIYNGNVIMSEKQIEVRQISGNIIYVKQDGSDSNLGDSWDNAFADVQKAIDTASTIATNTEPAQVWIAHGTYTNAGGLSTTSYVMKNNVEIYGGFVGTETKLDERVSGNETILTTSGDYVFYNNYSSSKRLTNTARIDSVTITGADSYGIYNYDYSSPTITNCTIADNGSSGIYNYDYSSPTITNCTIAENSIYGIYNYDYSSPTITNCTIHENGRYGIYNYDYSSPTITNCTIAENSSWGILNSSSSTPTITNCTIAENGYAGINNQNSSSPTITNCTIASNGDDGIFNSLSSPTITNCTIFGNRRYGICNSSSSPMITNCIIWGNDSRQIDNSYSSSTPSVSYCVIEGGYSDGTNIITEDPLLGELGNYGGFVNTIPVLTGSSAIGAGTTGENVPATDARGVDRSAPPTIGAYEYVVQNSFDTWAQENKLTGDNAKPEAMPHSDGITNLEKFTFGLDASKPTSYAESGLFKQTSDGTNVSFQYPVNKAATDVSVKVLISEDLIHWTEVTATKLGASDNMDLFEVNKQIPEGGKLFFKVEINE